MTLRRTPIKRHRPRYPSPAQLELRRQWALEHGFCWLCRYGDGYRGTILDVHEIASKAQAPGRWADVRNYARVCRACHDEVFSTLSEAAQYALKALNDPDNYDRSWINKARGEANTAISEADVKFWCRFIKAIRG